jgi:AraC family transcriptional regulator
VIEFMNLCKDFFYPAHRSRFESICETDWEGSLPLRLAHIRTSAGFNTSALPQHVIGLHLGTPVPILHQRDQVETLNTFRPGDIVFTPAGTEVHYAHAEPVEALYITINPQWVDQIAAQIGAPNQAASFADKWWVEDPKVANIGYEMLREMRNKKFGAKLYIETLGIQLLIHLLRGYASEPLPVTQQDEERRIRDVRLRLRPAIDYIHDHLAEDISLKNIAETVFLTPYHFSRLFRRAYGIAPYQYVLQQRIEKARDLLQQTTLTVAEIALRVGFADHSHLVRHYKRLTGKTPRG